MGDDVAAQGVVAIAEGCLVDALVQGLVNLRNLAVDDAWVETVAFWAQYLAQLLVVLRHGVVECLPLVVESGA